MSIQLSSNSYSIYLGIYTFEIRQILLAPASRGYT